PRAHQVIDTTRSKEATKDPEYDFLATPYSSVASLRNRYNIVYSGDESIGGAAAARLEFTPIKPSSVRKLTLWVDQKAWIPIQYQFVEESTTTTFTLSALSINQKISPESFILKPAPGTEEQKR
ncbi:MAG TPA: hypothetical protein VEZ90_03870, partial [Blastocatellia bacterium]|nr:hypothetical protein [Blastocatellia bacterium]